MRRSPAAASLAAVIVLTACAANAFGPRTPVATQSLTLYGITGTPLSFPTAIGIQGPTLFGTRAEVSLAGSADFDVAFDFDFTSPASPGIRVMPARTVATLPGSALASVSLARATVAFEAANSAPTGGWIADTAVVVRPGETLFVLTNRCGGNFFAVSTQQYSKLVVDSIYPEARKLRVRVATDPNCGQRSFPTPDFPPSSP